MLERILTNERLLRIARLAGPVLAAAVFPVMLAVVGMAARLPAESGRWRLVTLALITAVVALGAGVLSWLKPRIAHFAAGGAAALALWVAIMGRLVTPGPGWIG